ncbi:MAG: DUF4337 domain-containing protein [Gemmataceae bacterium]
MPELELPNPEELAEQAQERFTKRVALSVAFYAVCLAVSSLGGNNAMKEAMLSQMEASNRWAYFQAKSSREYLTKVTLDRWEADRGPARENDEVAGRWKKDMDRYADEKGKIEKEAKEKERERDLAVRRDPYFDYAEVLLQIGIVLASVAILSKSRPAYFVSLVMAICGAALCVNGFTLWFKVPGIGQ